MNLRFALSFVLALLPAVLLAQSLDPAMLTKAPTDTWPTYHGDYSGKRYSTLAQINRSNVGNLTLAWMYRTNALAEGTNVGGAWKQGDPTFWGVPTNNYRIDSSPLMVDGVLFFTAVDRVWSINARTGKEIWEYHWKTTGGHTYDGDRGVGMYHSWLYVETSDCYLVSLDATTGKERWHKQIADVRMGYWCTLAPVVAHGHVLAGVSDDAINQQGWFEAVNPETGDLEWKWYTTPQNPGDVGYDSWPNEYARTHGGGMTWQPPTYDPELNLVYIATGNPNPVGAGQSRKGDDLFSCSLVALNADTGKLVWYFQMTPHDTHDFDNVAVPVLFDALWNGKPRKMVAQASRNGYFFVLDRATGQDLLTKPVVDPQFINWSMGINSKGQPIPNPAKEPQLGGTLVGPGESTSWEPPSFDPQNGLFYVGTSEGMSLAFLDDTSERPEGYGFSGGGGGGGTKSELRAIDYRTGEAKWTHDTHIGPQGLMTTAGHLLFGSDGDGNFIAFDADTGKILWHAGLLSNPTNGPETFLLDGQQFIVVGAGDTVYAFTLNR